MHKILALSSAIAVLAGMASAENVVGTWLTGPDQKGQVAHVDIEPCGGDTVCGTIVRAFDKDGNPVVTKNVGKRIFWDMARQEAQGAYFGKAYVPVFRATYDAGMTLSGNRLKVKGCAGPICKSQTWTRVN